MHFKKSQKKKKEKKKRKPNKIWVDQGGKF